MSSQSDLTCRPPQHETDRRSAGDHLDYILMAGPMEAWNCSLVRAMSASPCERDVTFGCSPSEQRVWVSGGCRGFFLCTGLKSRFSCSSSTQRHYCACDPVARISAKAQRAAAGTAQAELRLARLWDTPAHRGNASRLREVVRGAQCGAAAAATSGPSPARVVRQQLIRTLYHGHDPFLAINPKRERGDHRYPHSNLQAAFVRAALLTLGGDARFWLEVGSFVGNSIILTASVAAELCYDSLSLVACDSFLGDAGMWQHGKGQSGGANYDFLRLASNGRPTIHERFMANVVLAHAAPLTLPLTLPSLVGLRLLSRLHESEQPCESHRELAPLPTRLCSHELLMNSPLSALIVPCYYACDCVCYCVCCCVLQVRVCCCRAQSTSISTPRTSPRRRCLRFRRRGR